jgi:hypothetical protein
MVTTLCLWFVSSLNVTPVLLSLLFLFGRFQHLCLDFGAARSSFLL